MCRVLLGSKVAIMEYQDKHSVLDLLDHLEVEMGGHGNGLALSKGKVITYLEKGLKYDIYTAADALLSQDYTTACFHTRIASVGKVSDNNNHPYIDHNHVMAMNGTLLDYSDIANAMSITDTEVVFKLVSNLKPKKIVNVLQSLHAVFIGIKDGIPYVSRNGGDLAEYNAHKGFLFSSSFPESAKADVKALTRKFSYLDGVRTSHVEQYKSDLYGYYDYDYRTDPLANLKVYSPTKATPKTSYKTSTYESTRPDSDYERGYSDGYELGYYDASQELSYYDTPREEI
jgi:predicted glutamine amidotransferase